MYMSIFNAIFLGIVQGLTEFIPVSSSGHLILAREALGISLDGSLIFDVILHFATALAVFLYFRSDIVKMIRKPRDNRVLWGALILGTIPALVIGFFFGDAITAATRTTSVVVWMLVVGSLLFILAEVLGSKSEKLSEGKGFLVGFYQAFAFIPGVSRSGASISGGMLLGLDREEATRFAFLLGFPILVGVGILKLLELLQSGLSDSITLPLVIGALVAFFVGLGAIHFMLKFLRTHTLYVFALYRVLLAILVFIFL